MRTVLLALFGLLLFCMVWPLLQEIAHVGGDEVASPSAPLRSILALILALGSMIALVLKLRRLMS